MMSRHRSWTPQSKRLSRRAEGSRKRSFSTDLINGFAASVPEAAYGEVQAMGAEHNAVVEEDKIVNAYSPGT
jgi:hypothetical protein